MTFAETLPIIINVLLCILLVVLIIFIIKCIIVVDKADKLCDNIEKKVNTLNGLFNAIGAIDSHISNLVGMIFGGVEGLLNKVLKKDKKNGDNKDE